MAACLIYVTFLLVFVEKSYESGFQSFGVLGGMAFMNWTISDRTIDYGRYVFAPFDNTKLLVFLPGETIAKVLDERVSYTGDICRGIISFTLSGLTPSDAGMYKYMIHRDNEPSHAGGQELVIAAVGVRGSDTIMSWRVNDTSVKHPRFVKSPYGKTVLYYPEGSYKVFPTKEFKERLTDIRNLINGTVFYRLTDITPADVGRYTLIISENTSVNVDAGGQMLVLADFPANVRIRETTKALLNARYTVQCSASSSIFPPNVTLPIYYQWRMDGKAITTGNRYIVSKDGTELTIAALQQEDSTTLTCTALQDKRAISETAFYVEAISPDVSNASQDSSMRLIITGITAGIFFIIAVFLTIYILMGKSKQGIALFPIRANNILDEENAYITPVAAENDADISGSQRVDYYEMLQDSCREQDQYKYYDKVQI
ncbi:hypothetical protein ACJMK2_017959 [Sinanodonta woodiana]|uniref:Ig-like domain-containing protein n=1 Tax=Sinanodonta woodiana TaxID=1069815 RepID=A0ABD3UFU4_SINWO